MDRIISELNKRISKDPGFLPIMAYLLGYSSTAAIIQWIRRGSIPFYHLDNIRRILDGRIKVTVNGRGFKKWISGYTSRTKD